VSEPDQVIVVQFGNPQHMIQEPGLYFKLPFVQNVIRLEKRVLSTDARTAEYLTLDKKRVMVDQILRWRITNPLEFSRSVRALPRAQARLDDNIGGRLRQEIAAHNFLDLVQQKREEIMETVTKDVRETATAFGIEVLDVRIKQVDLPSEVQASVFARMRAERERIAKRYRAEGEERAREIRVGADKEREILLATAYETSQQLSGAGDAEAAAMYANAFGQDPEFYGFVRRLHPYEKTLGAGITIVLPSDSDLLRYLQTAR
jgi:modulator of FtsH protease HflC